MLTVSTAADRFLFSPTALIRRKTRITASLSPRKVPRFNGIVWCLAIMLSLLGFLGLTPSLGFAAGLDVSKIQWKTLSSSNVKGAEIRRDSANPSKAVSPALVTYGVVRRVVYNQEAGVVARLCYYYDPDTKTCKADPTTISTVTAPQHGTIRIGTLDLPVGDQDCPGAVLPYDTLFYTWTDPPSLAATQQDRAVLSYISTACAAEDFNIDVTFQLNKSPKNLGKPDCPSCMEGNPINAATGNKFQAETDYQGPAQTQLEFKRYYNSLDLSGYQVLGNHWHSTYHRGLTPPENAGDPVKITRADGREDSFTYDNITGEWVSDADVASRLSEIKNAGNVQTGWVFMTEDDEREEYSIKGLLLSITNRVGQKTSLSYTGNGQLMTVTGPFGHALTFTYDPASGLLQTLQTPDHNTYQYHYKTHPVYGYNTGNLESVTYPDAKVRTYLYENNDYVEALTGILDENNVRYATFNYDSQGLAYGSEHAGGVEKVSITYNADGTSDVVDPYLNNHRYTFIEQFGVKKPIAVAGLPVTTMGSKKAAYDTDGNVKSRTDFKGNTTCYVYDLTRNLERARIEGLAPGKRCPANIIGYTPAAGTPERKILTQWHTTLRLPVKISEPQRITTFTYNGDAGITCGAGGALCRQTVRATTDATGGQGFTAPLTGLLRTWNYTYNTAAELTSVNGPRTDVLDRTVYAYYATDAANGDYRKGDLQTVTDAENNVTTYNTYNLNGSPTRITDANGLVTDLDYDTRNRLHTVTVAGRVTTFEYRNNLLWKVITPDQGTIEYGYDDAHRLTRIMNGANESLVYTLDNHSKRTKEETYAAGAIVASTKLNRKFDALGRLWQVMNAANQVVEISLYDNQGNRTFHKANPDASIANQQVTQFDYDALNRLTTITDATLTGLSTLTHDGLDHVAAVEDPRLHATTYDIDGLDNLNQEASPDRGTINNTLFDAAGNVISSTDARNQTTQSAYDALNRLVSAGYANGTSAAYQYDTGVGAAGKLNYIDDVTGYTDWLFDGEGRLVTKTQTTGALQRSVAYSYDPLTGRVDTMTYPSGAVFKVTYDTAGRPNMLSYALNASAPWTVIVDNITYMPLGEANQYRLPAVTGTPTLVWGYDANGRINRYPVFDSSATLRSKSLIRDRLGHVKTLGDTGNTANDQTYLYDKLNRLTDVTAPGLTQHYDYDAAGNRTLRTVNGVDTVYTPETLSNRLGQVNSTVYKHDGAGNLTGPAKYRYDARNRLTRYTTAANVVYQYGINALGQRVSKTSSALSTGGRVYVYDDAGHLIGEYDRNGVRQREYLYLGDRPIAALGTNGGVFYVLSDHLKTPRQVIDSNKQLRWTWDNRDPFGNNAANANPMGLGGFAFNLRFAGQSADSESGLFYNCFREYDPRLGRYVESDPIGLESGLNTYTYVRNNPLIYDDPLGLLTLTIGRSLSFGGGEITLGYAVSFPDPFTGGEFDSGIFTEVGINPSVIQSGEYDPFALSIFDLIFKSTTQVGVQGGAVCDLAGKGAEVGAAFPYTPIPGTTLPNPWGPTIGGSGSFDNEGNFTGINIESGIGGTGIHGYGTMGATLSVWKGFSK